MPDLIRLVRASNPGPMTLEGTNTYLVGDPAAGAPAVIDPGPRDEAHLAAVLAAAGGRVAVILLTHRHADHAEAAPELAAQAGCDVRAIDPAYRRGRGALGDGDVIAVPGGTLRTVLTPGHTDDSCCFVVESDEAPARLLSGDTVLGRGTTVITRPDGDLRDYLASLDRLEQVVAEAAVREILPGHGPRVGDPVERLRLYRTHRYHRLDQVRAARAAGAVTAGEIVARVYADVDRALWPAAEQSVAAQLDYLRAVEGLPDS